MSYSIFQLVFSLWMLGEHKLFTFTCHCPHVHRSRHEHTSSVAQTFARTAITCGSGAAFVRRLFLFRVDIYIYMDAGYRYNLIISFHTAASQVCTAQSAVT